LFIFIEHKNDQLSNLHTNCLQILQVPVINLQFFGLFINDLKVRNSCDTIVNFYYNFLGSINGENVHYGTPRNPCAPDRVPGGSSSGSAVAVGANLADFSLGAIFLPYY